MRNMFKTKNMRTRILLVASEFAPGMIPFASKIITLLNGDEKFEVFAIVVNSNKFSYLDKVKGLDENHLLQVEYPKSKFLKLVYKFYPYSIINELDKFNKKYNPDIIHFLTGDFSLASYVMSFRNKSKLFYTVHDLHPHEVSSNRFIKSLFYKYVVIGGYRKLHNMIPNLTTSSRSQYKELMDIYPNKRIVFTHFPSLLTPQIQDGNKSVVELVKEKDYILFFGQVNEYKGVDLLIKAYTNSKLLQRLKLVIAGRGNGYSDIINNKNIIRINRFIDDSEVKDLFSKAAFIVYPYRSATMSGVLSIAYFFKKKVLVSSIPFFMDNATSASVFFENGNIEDLQKCMEQIVNDNLKITENCYDEIYSDDEILKDYHNLYFKS